MITVFFFMTTKRWKLVSTTQWGIKKILVVLEGKFNVTGVVFDVVIVRFHVSIIVSDVTVVSFDVTAFCQGISIIRVGLPPDLVATVLLHMGMLTL
jgi:hypothetical protein